MPEDKHEINPENEQLLKEVEAIINGSLSAQAVEGAETCIRNAEHEATVEDIEAQALEYELQVLTELASKMGADIFLLKKLFMQYRDIPGGFYTVLNESLKKTPNKGMARDMICRFQQILILVHQTAQTKLEADTGMHDDLDKTSNHTKRAIQASIVDSSDLEPEDKVQLTNYVEKYLEGRGIDMSDPDDILAALNEDAARMDEHDSIRAEVAKSKILIKKELAKYPKSETDPAFREIISLISSFVVSMRDADQVVDTVMAIYPDKFKSLDIRKEDFVASINSVLEKLK